MTDSLASARLRPAKPAEFLLRALLLLSPVFHADAASAVASTDTRHQALFLSHQLPFEIASQPLHSALTAYAEQSGLQIFFRTEQLPDIITKPVSGTFSPRAALEQLLPAELLSYRFGNHNTLVIRTRTDQPQSDTEANLPANASISPSLPLEETYVTGVRSTLRRSLAIKQRSSNLVDVTTSEDIGKFPDHNVADSLQRIAGVSVDRLWGEGRDVNIRGTDKDINRTLLNGQHVASAYWWANDNLSRGFNYSTLASQLVQSLEVHKTPRAELDEGSIGGTVIVRTRKPLEMASREMHLSLERQYSDLADAWKPQASALGSWQNTSGTLGVLASANWQNRESRRDGLETFSDNNLYRITDTANNSRENVYAVWGGGSAILQQQRAHTTSNLTLQWAPYEQWDTALNLIRSQMEIDNTNHNFLFVPGGYKLSETPPVAVANPNFLTTDDGNLMLAGGILGNPDSTGAVLDSIQREAYIDTAVNDLDIHYRGDLWHSHLQMGYTAAEGGTEHDRLYRFTGNTRVGFQLTPDAIETNYLDLDPEDASALANFSPLSRDWIRAMENSEHYLQADIGYQFDHPWLRAASFGVKARNHWVENNLTVGSIDTGAPAWQRLQHIGLDRVSSGLSPILSAQSANNHTLTRYAVTDPRLLQSTIQPLYDQGAMTYHYDRNAYFRVREQTLAYYVSLSFETGLWSGDSGLRAVTTRQLSSAYANSDADEKLHNIGNNYRDYLPSLNLQYRLTPRMSVRLGAAQVMARPNFKDLSPSIIIDPTSGSGAAGNPKLAPYRADQLDLSVDWYFADASLISATAFYKDISTFVYPHVFLEQIDGQSLYITRPQNGPGADIRGFELQWQQDFSNGLGVLSNYTFTDASVPSPDGNRTLELPGNSRSQFNASLYFDRQKFSGRLSYNYRSRSFGEIVAGSQSETADHRQWDATAQWQLNSALTLTAEAVNLTDEVIFIRSASGIPQGFYENGRRFMVGLQLNY